MSKYGWGSRAGIALVGAMCCGTAWAGEGDGFLARMLRFSDTDHKATIDYGPGTGVARPEERMMAGTAAASTVPNGGPTAFTGGFFGPAVNWPIIPIHAVLLPDGRVMNYGTSQNGSQGAALIYDVWDPSLGTGSDSHLVLPNTTGTDIFCSAQSLMWNSDTVLISGGDLTVNKTRNYSNNQTTYFSPQSNTIAAGPQMQYPRWYDSIVPLANSEMLVLGGRTAPGVAATTPEVYNPTTGYRTLTGATSDPAFNITAQNWYYPRGFVHPNGSVFMLVTDGTMWTLNPAGTGTISKLSQSTFGGTQSLPTIMFAPGRLLSVRTNSRAVVVDISKDNPVVTQIDNISQDRLWSNATVLPDGRVVVTGGSSVANVMTGVAYQAELWNPRNGKWTLGAAASKPRLYHSISLLLPDATVLTAGGGAPGPINELNAEIYYPPYLYRRDGSGLPMPRPTLVTAPAVVAPGQPFTATVVPGQNISAVTFVRSGSVTHSANLDQRFINMPFAQAGATLTVLPQKNTNLLLPGYYMMFALNAAGTPSIAKMVLVQG